MTSLYQTVKSCIYKTPVSEQVEVLTTETEESLINADDLKENDTTGCSANKKTDEISEPGPQGGLVWRMSSGLYNATTGAVGYGVGGVKWVAGKSYNVGSAVVSHVKVPTIQKFRRKDKKE